MVEIRRITQDDTLYPQEVDLRVRVLLDPIGYDMQKFNAEFPGIEQRFEHFVAVAHHPTGERVVGCATLLADYPDEGVGKLMQMAVDPQRRAEGIGRNLVVALERRAFGELGLHQLFCHARTDAAPFYAALGWTVEGDPFQEAGIEHFKMVFPGQGHGETEHAAPTDLDVNVEHTA